MSTFDVDDLGEKVLSYIQNHFKNDSINRNAKLVDLSFESIDYIALAAFIFKKTGRWVDISRIDNSTRISDISSYLVNLEQRRPKRKLMVKLDDLQRYVYSSQFEDKDTIYVTYIIQYLCLKEGIDLSKLQRAIEDTLKNHYILNSRLIRIIDDYYFEKNKI